MTAEVVLSIQHRVVALEHRSRVQADAHARLLVLLELEAVAWKVERLQVMQQPTGEVSAGHDIGKDDIQAVAPRIGEHRRRGSKFLLDESQKVDEESRQVRFGQFGDRCRSVVLDLVGTCPGKRASQPQNEQQQSLSAHGIRSSQLTGRSGAEVDIGRVTIVWR